MEHLLYRLGEPLFGLDLDGRLALAVGGTAEFGRVDGGRPLVAYVPPLRPESLGDRAFLDAHGLQFPYVAGAMANGIGSCEIVEAMGRAGMLGFFGAGGLAIDRVESAIDRLQSARHPWGMNLLHAPNDPALETATVHLYLDRGVRLAEAAAYLDLTLPLVRYRTAGIHVGPDGRVVAPNRVIAKVSRVEVATRFFSPPPEAMLRALVAEGHLTPQQAELASRLPVAEDVTAEADSGGHTDNRPAIALLPTFIALGKRLTDAHRYERPLRVGAAGGIATPAGVAAAFAMGASYVLTGSINQACREAGTSQAVRELLAAAQQADTAMAPAGDMFEMGVKVQVLKRGTMFAMRASKLYEIYRSHDGLDALSRETRQALERDVFRQDLESVWNETHAYFAARDPGQIERANRDPKHRMALVFRWYLGQSSRWANTGVADRAMDYQIWCGPAMGAFNEWARGSALERDRGVVMVARQLLAGACAVTRRNMLAMQGFTRLEAGAPLDPAALEAALG